MTEEWIRRRRDQVMEDPVRREIVGLLGDGLSIRQLCERLSGDRGLTEVNRHLAELQAADLVWAEGGRYRRVLR